MQQFINIFLVLVCTCVVVYLSYRIGHTAGVNRTIERWMFKFGFVRSIIIELRAQLKYCKQQLPNTINQEQINHSSWLIFDQLKLYPNLYVAQRFENDMPTKEIFTARNLKELRMQLPADLFRSDPHENCISNVVEIWF